MTIERTAVNPVSWSLEMGFNQGELVEGHTRTLYCSGQTAMDADGKPQHDGDLPAQLALSLDNLEAVLTEAGMSLTNLVRLNVHTTDVDLLFPHYGVLAARLHRRRRPHHHNARRNPPRHPRPTGRARSYRRGLTAAGLGRVLHPERHTTLPRPARS